MSQITPAARKMRDFYALKPGAPIYQSEFGFYALNRWIAEGHLPPDPSSELLNQIFGYDSGGKYSLGGAGWCEFEFEPRFPELHLRDVEPDKEVIQDFAGRQLLVFRGRRSGFMPEYLDHPVKDQRSWEELCLWRLDPTSPERIARLEASLPAAKAAEAEGQVICQRIGGGYMLLRSLIGPLELMYMVYDDPDLIHTCMRTWFAIADAACAKHQEAVDLDELFFGEDICYNHGLLISEDMVREFLFPYYQQLISNAQRRQKDPNRRIRIQLDTDGFSDPAIPLYQEIGLDFLSPFEVASGCDVVRTGQEYPKLLISGGIDKRVLAQGKDAIDRELERIMPVMHARGGYLPTCDHGVPEEVSFDDYLHYRKRMLEYA